MNLTLRKAASGEKDAILRVYYASWRAAYKNLLPQEALTDASIRSHIELNLERSWVALTDGRNVGTIQFGPNPDDPPHTAEIRTLYLLPEYRRTGIGSRMMHFALDWLASRGYTRAYLWMFAANTDALRFYETLGFHPTGDTESYMLGEGRHEGIRLQAEIRPVLPYHTGPHKFWDDPHISKSMLRAHLDPETDAASRKPDTIQNTVRWLLTRHPEAKTVLDLGCGPGLYTGEFHRAGLAVTGIDLSERSIAYARAHTPAIDYRVGNYLELAGENAYDLITLIYYDYDVLPPAHRARLVRSIHRALKPCGIFAVDVLHPNHLRGFSEGIQTPDMGDFFTEEAHTVSVTSLYYPETKNILDRYDVRTDDETKTWYIWNALFTKESLLKELETFTSHEFFADLTGNPVTEESTVLAGKR